MKTKKVFIALAVGFLVLFTSGKEKDPPEKFTIVVLPDTQYYTDHFIRDLDWPPCILNCWHYCDDADCNVYENQTAWIAGHKDEYNIKLALHMGDIVNDGDEEKKVGGVTVWTGQWWSDAVTAHNLLTNAGIPFCVVPGNHDYEDGQAFDHTDLYSRDLDKYDSHFGNIAAWSGKMDGTIANTYYEFDVDEFNLQFLVLNLEQAPRKDVLCWANSVIQDHPYHRVIVVTHCYQTSGAVRCDCTSEAEGPPVGSDGWHLWDELIQRNSNIFMVLSGHKNDSEYRQRLGLTGNPVHEILTDYQYESAQGSGHDCGNGWLRLLEFHPIENIIYVITKTVKEGSTHYFDNGAPEFFRNDYNSDPDHADHKYSFSYDMTSSMVANVHTPLTDHFNDRTVNEVGENDQQDPAIASDQNGNFVVVWMDNNGEDEDIEFRRFDAGGKALSSDALVNSITTGEHNNPAVAMNPDGNFVVVWQYDGNNDDDWGVWYRLFNSAGTPIGPMVEVQPPGSGTAENPQVSMNTLGDFVVVWQDDTDGNNHYEIYGSGYSHEGSLQFGPIVINSDPQDSQKNPDIAMDVNGNFVVVWMDDNGINDRDIEYRRFDAGGNPLSSDALVNGPITSDEHVSPSVAMTPSGEFIVTWQYDSNENNIWGIWARRFSSNGTPIGNMFPLNPTSSHDQQNAKVSVNSGGDFIIVWADEGIEVNGYYEIYGSKYSPTGVLLYGPFSINKEDAGQQIDPDIVLNSNGTFVTVWEDDMDKNGHTEILARGLQMYNLTVECTVGGTVNPVSSVGISGSYINVVATPFSNMNFSHWTGAVEDPNNINTKVFMDRDHTVKAWFDGPGIDGFPGTALDFDGTNDYVECGTSGSIGIGNELTIEAWIKVPASFPATSRVGNIIGNYDHSPNFNFEGHTDGRLRFYWNGGQPNIYADNFDMRDDTWHHVAVTRNFTSNQIILYVDGVVHGTTTAGSNTNCQWPLRIGKDFRADPGIPFNGKIEEVRLWNVALNEEQIRENMNLPLVGTESGLISTWQFNEGTGTTANEIISGNNGTLVNMNNADWITSTIPYGYGFADSQTETNGMVEFAGTGLTMDFISQSGAEITVARIDLAPNLSPTGLAIVFDDQYWVVNRYGSGSFDADLTFTLAEDLTPVDENYPANIRLYGRPSTSDTDWEFAANAASVNAANNQVSFEGITGFSQFIIGKLHNNFELYLNVNLEGPFNGIDMNADLNSTSVLPLNQPFNNMPWNYPGTESVIAIPNADIVDWILVEIRDAPFALAADTASVVARKATFLLKDGSVVATDGSANPAFDNSINEQLFVVIWHRNHLGVMSAFPLVESEGIYSYEFSIDGDQAYGTGSLKYIGGGVFGMFAGDANADGIVNEIDKDPVWETQAGIAGYLSADLNMDGQCDNREKDDLWIPNQGIGSQVPFTAYSCPGIPMVNYEGQTYYTIQIGDQCWLKENLNVGTMISGATAQSNNSQIEKYCYDDDPANCATYGGLYQWDEMMQYSTQQGAQGICPVGWHLPMDAEWCTLTQFIDPTVNCNFIGWSGTDGGTKLKSISGWISSGNGTDTFGFSAVPGGGIDSGGNFGGIGYTTSFWTSTQKSYINPESAWFRSLDYNQNGINRGDPWIVDGRSVRCLKDN
jgi:uncharacterized protein (TIGR02145 family)